MYLLSLPGLVALGLGLAIAGFFPAIFDLSPAVRPAAQLLIVLLAVDLALSVPGDTFGAALIGMQRYDLVNVTLIGVSLAQALAWAVVLAFDGGLVALGAVTAAISLCGQAARFLLVRRLVPELSLHPSNFDRGLVRPFAGLSAWFALRDIALVVRSRLDTVVVGLLLGVASAGIYGVGQKLALVVERLSYPIATTFFPYSAELKARHDVAGLRAAVLTGTRLSLGVGGPMCLVVGLLAGPALDVWVGPQFSGARLVVVYLAGAAAVKIVTYTGVAALGGMGEARGPSLVASGEAALNLVLSVVLGSWMGLSGVALATLIASLSAELLIMLPLICRRLEVSLAAFLAGLAKAHLPPVAVSVAVASLIGAGRLDGPAALALDAAAIVGAYFIVFAITGVQPAERRAMRSHLYRLHYGNLRSRRADRKLAAQDDETVSER